MKKNLIALAALTLMAWGCSSSDNETPTPTPPPPTPSTIVIEAGTDTRPTTWQTPDFNLFEQTMNVEILLQEELQSYASDEDLLCATIGSDIRGLATPLQVDGTWVFPLTVGSNETDAAITLSYYCDRLHRIFTIAWTTFDATIPPTGSGSIYQPTFFETK